MNVLILAAAGLAAHFYCDTSFKYHTETREVAEIGTAIPRAERPAKTYPECLPDYITRGEEGGVIYKGMLEVPADGVYRFRSAPAWAYNPELVEFHWHREAAPQQFAIRVAGSLRDLTWGEKAITLKKGKQPLRVYIPKYMWGTEHVEWMKPGDKTFSTIPAEAFSHDEADVKNTVWQDSSIIPERIESANRHSRKYRVKTDADGFYVLNIRRLGVFRWGVLNPPIITVLIDGNEVRTYFTADSKPGAFDSQRETIYLNKGEHIVELRGTEMQMIDFHESVSQTLKGDRDKAVEIEKQICASRVWLDRLVPGVDDEMAWTLRQSLNAESVFAKGEEVKWNFRRSTLSGAAGFTIRVTPLRDTSGVETWSGSVSLPAGKRCAEGSITFPKDICGSFEYRVYDGNGRLLEGPWEFLVMDPTPVVLEKESAAYDPDAEYEAIPSGGKRVDVVDFAKEGLMAKHLVRDNGTSTVVTNGNLIYRESGGQCQWGCYHNLDAKDGTDPIKFLGHLKDKDRKGRSHGMSFIDWFGCTLDVKHPGQAHLAVAYVPEDKLRRVLVQLLDPVTTYMNGAVYRVEESVKPGYVKVVIPFWPTSSKIDVLFHASSNGHNSPSTPTAIAKIELYEYPNGFPALPEAAMGWNKKRTVFWSGEQGDLGPEKASTPLPWEGDYKVSPMSSRRDFAGNGWLHYDYKAYSTAWRRFGEYARFNGDTRLVWPLHSYGMAHVKTERLPWGGSLFIGGRGFTDNDRYTRNTLKIILLNCAKYGVGLVGDFQINSDFNRYAGIVAETEGVSKDELNGLFLEDGKQYPAHNFNPAHPVARRFLVNFYSDIARACRGSKGLEALNIRNLSWSSSIGAWFKHWTVGYDEFTTGVFTKETGVAVNGATRDERYDDIMHDKAKREKWFRWRVEKTVSLRREILAGMRRYLPDVKLSAEGAESAFAYGAGLDAELLKDEHDLGFGFRDASSYTYGIEMNCLDPVSLDNFDQRAGIEKLTPFEKLNKCHSWYPVGICTAGGVFAAPYGTRAWALALAEAPLDRLTRGGYWCFPPGEESMRRFVQAWRAIPDGKYRRITPDASKSVALWCSGDTAYLVNMTPSVKTVAIPVAARDRVTSASVDEAKIVVPAFGLRTLAVMGTPQKFRVLEEAESKAVKVNKPRDWMDNTAKTRVLVNVTNPGASESPRTLGIVKGKDIFAYGGSIETLKVMKDGQELPVQFDPDDEISFLVPFKAGETDATVHFYLDAKDPKRFADPFVTATNAPSVEKPYDTLVRDGDIAVGFCGRGIAYLERNGASALRSVSLRGDKRPYVNPILSFSWETDGYTQLRKISSGPVRTLWGLEATSVTNVDSLLYTKGGNFNAVYLENGRGERRYQLIAGDDTLSVEDRYSWTASYANFCRWFWYNTGYREHAFDETDMKLTIRDASKGIVSSVFKPSDDPKRDGTFECMHDAAKPGWLEMENVKSGAVYDLAVDLKNNVHLAPYASLMIRADVPVAKGEPGSTTLRYWLRIPAKADAVAADRWHERVSGLQPECMLKRAETL